MRSLPPPSWEDLLKILDNMPLKPFKPCIFYNRECPGGMLEVYWKNVEYYVSYEKDNPNLAYCLSFEDDSLVGIKIQGIDKLLKEESPMTNQKTLGSMAKHISDTLRRDKEQQKLDAMLKKRASDCEKAKKDLHDNILRIAQDGGRHIIVMSLEEGGLVVEDDIPQGLTCPHYREMWQYLIEQDLEPTLGSSRLGYGVYHYFMEASW